MKAGCYQLVTCMLSNHDFNVTGLLSTFKVGFVAVSNNILVTMT